MQEPERLSPLQQRSGEAVVLRWPDLVIEERPFVRKLAIRGHAHADPFTAAFRTAFGVEPPRAGNAVEATEATLLRLGPTEWLAVDRVPGSAAPRPAADGVTDRLAATGLLTVDVSSATTILRVSGPRLHRTLRKLSAMQVDGLAAGSVARTRMGRLGILLHVLSPDDFDLFVSRTYARSFLGQLRDAADLS